MTGPQLAHCRRQLGLSQSALAAALSISLRTIQRYEDAPVVPQGIAWALLELKHQRTLKYPNGAPMFDSTGMMLDEQGNRSIFDDVDK